MSIGRRRFIVVLEITTLDSYDTPGNWSWETLCDVDGCEETVRVIHESETKECPQ